MSTQCFENLAGCGVPQQAFMGLFRDFQYTKLRNVDLHPHLADFLETVPAKPALQVTSYLHGQVLDCGVIVPPQASSLNEVYLAFRLLWPEAEHLPTPGPDHEVNPWCQATALYLRTPSGWWDSVDLAPLILLLQDKSSHLRGLSFDILPTGTYTLAQEFNTDLISLFTDDLNQRIERLNLLGGVELAYLRQRPDNLLTGSGVPLHTPPHRHAVPGPVSVVAPGPLVGALDVFHAPLPHQQDGTKKRRHICPPNLSQVTFFTT